MRSSVENWSARWAVPAGGIIVCWSHERSRAIFPRSCTSAIRSLSCSRASAIRGTLPVYPLRTRPELSGQSGGLLIRGSEVRILPAACGNTQRMMRRPALAERLRGPFAALFPHHREHEAHQVVTWMIVAAALSLIATILVAGAAGYSAVASHLKEAN